MLLSYGADPDLQSPDWISSDTVRKISQDEPDSEHIASAVHLLLTRGADPNPWIYYMLISVARTKGLENLLGWVYSARNLGSIRMKTKWVTQALAAPEKSNSRLDQLLREAVVVRDSFSCPADASTQTIALCLPNALKNADEKMIRDYESRLQAAPRSARTLRDQQRQWLRNRDAKCGLEELPGINKAGWYAYILSNRERAQCTLRETTKRATALSNQK